MGNPHRPPTPRAEEVRAETFLFERKERANLTFVILIINYCLVLGEGNKPRGETAKSLPGCKNSPKLAITFGKVRSLKSSSNAISR